MAAIVYGWTDSACTALGTRTIINCPSEAEPRPGLKAGAADCLASLETPGAIDGLKTSIETPIQLGRGAAETGAWVNRLY
jgi:hypothetical protein